MSVQFSLDVRNGRLDAVETVIGTGPKLYLRTGAPPANCAAADTGTLLATINLPSDWLAAAAAGSKVKAGTWSGTVATGGDVAHFRVKESTETVAHMQGTVTEDGGGGDMEVQQASTTLGVGQTVTVSLFTLTDGNA